MIKLKRMIAFDSFGDLMEWQKNLSNKYGTSAASAFPLDKMWFDDYSKIPPIQKYPYPVLYYQAKLKDIAHTGETIIVPLLLESLTANEARDTFKNDFMLHKVLDRFDKSVGYDSLYKTYVNYFSSSSTKATYHLCVTHPEVPTYKFYWETAEWDSINNKLNTSTNH